MEAKLRLAREMVESYLRTHLREDTRLASAIGLILDHLEEQPSSGSTGTDGEPGEGHTPVTDSDEAFKVLWRLMGLTKDTPDWLAIRAWMASTSQIPGCGGGAPTAPESSMEVHAPVMDPAEAFTAARRLSERGRRAGDPGGGAGGELKK